ncbi:MAG: response regulator [Chitinivibrionales bacterium]|nr:response regulator [Chitinivibrionales bacterium]
MFPEYKILVVDDDETVLTNSVFALATDGINNVEALSDSRLVMDKLAGYNCGIVLLDLLMPHIKGFDLLPQIHEAYPDTQVIVLTALNEVDTAVACMKSGAYDYLTKPATPERLIATVRQVIKYRDMSVENRRLRSLLLDKKSAHDSAFQKIITCNEEMERICRYITAIAQTSFPVLITGETGVGKELMAEALHTASDRGGRFVPVNIAGLPDQLLDDTLFGHARGAFTGAESDRQGLVGSAESGTLFLDEIGDMGPESQIKLLRFLQDGKFFPLGSDKPQFSDVRIVAATNKNLQRMQRDGSFRSDLFYRLQTHMIEIPPLRSRRDDVPLLVEHFLMVAAEKLDKKVPKVRKELFDLLGSYDYPGNVRELQGMIFDAMSVHEGGNLRHDAFYNKIFGRQQHQVEPLPDASEEPGENDGLAFPDELPALKDIEKLYISEAMRRAGGNQTLAAKMLKVSRKTLNNRILKYRVDDAAL